jgi:hypothetical protein
MGNSLYKKVFAKFTVTGAPVNDLNKIFEILGFHGSGMVRVNISVYIIPDCTLEIC